MVKRKKKAKKTVKRKKTVKKKKVIKKKKALRLAPRKKLGARSGQAKEKVIGNIEHFFSNISVAAMKLKAPLSVGDMIHIVGPHNDFVQRVDSIQIEHKDLQKAKKGQDIGFKVKNKVRVTDTVFLAAKEQGLNAQPAAIQKPIFPGMMNKSIPSAIPQNRPMPKKGESGGPRFLSF